MRQPSAAGRGRDDRRRFDRVGVGEVVVRVDVGFGQHLAAIACDGSSADRDLRGDGLVDMRVHHGQRDQLWIRR